MAVVVVLVVGGAVLASAGLAWAEASGSFRLTWVAPDECPSPSQVRAEIVRLVGGDIQALEGDLEATAAVSHEESWTATLTTQHAGQIGHRRIEAPSCKAVAESIALIIALLIDPDAVAANNQLSKTDARKTDARKTDARKTDARKTDARKTDGPSIPKSATSNESKWEFWAGGHAQGRVGTLPGLDLGAGLTLGVASGRWRTDVRGTYGLGGDQVASLPSGAAGRFRIWMASVTECFDLGQTAWQWGPCAAVEAGRVSVRGYGATVGFSRAPLWMGIGGGAFLSRAMVRHLRFLVEADLIAPLYRPDYVFEDIPGVVFKAPAVGGRMLADVSWRF